MTEPTVFYRVSEAAALANVSEASIRRWADAGKMSCVRLPGGERRIPAAEIDRLLTPQPSVGRSR